MSALLGLLGVLVGSSIALVTGWQSRRWAHQQWLLDRRQEAYADVLRWIYTLIDGAKAADDKAKRLELYSGVFKAVVHCQVVASEPVGKAMTALLKDANRFSRAETIGLAMAGHGAALQDLMRSDLTTPPAFPSLLWRRRARLPEQAQPGPSS